MTRRLEGDVTPAHCPLTRARSLGGVRPQRSRSSDPRFRRGLARRRVHLCRRRHPARPKQFNHL